jgi:SAM-dependent methyltransferase
VDLSPVLVDAANAKLAQAGARPGAAPVKFVCANAATAALEDAPFDVLFSRFGVMFFDDPLAAFAHMRGWLKPSGRTAFVCWAPPRENPWILEIETINKRYAATPDVDPRAPGPFALSDPDRLRDVLDKAGFVDVVLDSWRGGQAIGGPGATPEQAAQFAMTGMSVGQALKDASDEVKAKARADVLALFTKHHRPEGVMMPSTAWVVTANAS